jgi:hypothetical protein
LASTRQKLESVTSELEEAQREKDFACMQRDEKCQEIFSSLIHLSEVESDLKERDNEIAYLKEELQKVKRDHIEDIDELRMQVKIFKQEVLSTNGVRAPHIILPPSTKKIIPREFDTTENTNPLPPAGVKTARELSFFSTIL